MEPLSEPHGDAAEPPQYIRETDMDSAMGTGGVAYEWHRDTPSQLWISVNTPHQNQEITISAGDTVLGPDGTVRCTIDGINVWSITGETWIVEICVPNDQDEIIPHNAADFAVAYLGDESNGYEAVYELDECQSLDDEELEQARWEETVSRLRTLETGDTVRWAGRSEPLVVDGVNLFGERVYLEGPRGGKYRIDWRNGVPTIRQASTGQSLGRPTGFTVVSRHETASLNEK